MVTRKQWLKQFRNDLFSAAYDESICGFENTNQLAEAAGLSYQTVKNLETGETQRPSIWTIRQLCIATGTSLSTVMGDLKRATKSHRRVA